MAGKEINCDDHHSGHRIHSASEIMELYEPKPEPAMPEIGRELCRMKEKYGYRQDILTENLNEREKAIFICKNCQGIMKEACISQKGGQYCSCCLVHSKKTQNSSVREMINSLKCLCPLIERGCQWLGTLEGCENHLDTCGYVYETCKRNCGEVLRREEFERHEKENCSQRQVKCDHCDEFFKSIEMNGHLDKCPKMKVSCHPCGKKIRRENMELHLRRVCGMVQETCTLGCGVELTRDKLRIHEKENCQKRQVKCDHCCIDLTFSDIFEHLKECPKMEVSCNLCGTKITRENMELHLRCVCGMVQEKCTLGCGMELTRDKLRIHENENCVQRIIRCEHCCICVIFCDNSKHLKECPEMKVSCELCSVDKYRKDMTQHLEDDCPENMLDCPFVKYKCLTRMKRKDIDKHLEEKETKHLGLKLTAMEDLINKQYKEMTREISNTSQQIKLLYSITDTTKIIWKIENVKYYLMRRDPSFESKQYEVDGYMSALKFQYGKLSIVFPGTTIKPDRPFIAKCHILLHSCHTINCGIIEVKQKDVLRGYERFITFIPQEDIEKYSEPQLSDATKSDLTLEIFITMQ